jgi:C-terminal processing protease CtpA/Prc
MLFVDEFTSPYTIQAIKNNTDTVILTVDGLNRAAIDSLNKVLSTQQIKQSTPFSFTIRDNEIGYIAFNSMSRSLKDSFSRFLNSTFSFIKEKQLKGLVIDLRENSGGDSQVGELLLNYITTKHYRMGGGMKWKVSKHYKAYLDIVKDDDEDYRKKDNGEMFEYINPATKKPLNNAFTFNGKVAVLIGPNTFSSANMLADAIKEYQLATLFGEPTGECGNDYGETFDFMLSNTHIISRATSKMFIRASGDETDFSATTPNVFAKNINFKSDAVLETAVRWIFEGKQ